MSLPDRTIPRNSRGGTADNRGETSACYARLEGKSAMAQKSSRTYISDRFVIELDGQYVGTLQSIEGGTLKSAGVVEEKIGKESLVTRYPGRPQYDDITIQVGMTMAPRFWEWLQKSFNYDAEKRDALDRWARGLATIIEGKTKKVVAFRA